MPNSTFQRVEKKYQMTKAQYDAFLERISLYTRPEKYGLHTIRNIYYDTDNYELIRTSIEKPKYKEKLRLRGYGNLSSESSVFLEIKKKFDGVVYKRRISLSYKEAQDYLNHKIPPKIQNQIFKEIDYFLNHYKPSPKLYLAYDRIAYIGLDDPELRITVDRNIRSRTHNLCLTDDTDCTYYNNDLYLMEIKVPFSYPLWLSDLLSELKIYPNSFSKYGKIYANSIVQQ